MIDGTARRWIEPGLNRAGAWLARRGVKADHVTVFACCLGLAAALLIASGFMLAALALILVSRLCDGLDFVVYGAVPLGFVIHDPAANGLAGAALIFSFYVNGASFLAYAILAEKHRLTTTRRGAKSIYFTTGLAEAGETLIVFAIFCLWPAWFSPVAWAFTAICLYTALSRIIEARAAFPAGGSQA